MERKDLIIPTRPILICEEISTLLNIPQVNHIDYPFTYICRSISDPNRISGIPFKVLEGLAWGADNYQTQGKFNGIYQTYTSNNHNITSEFRLDKGVNLKPGKLVAAIYPDLTNQEVSLLADKWSNLLRQSSDADLSCLKISNKPSEIYTLEHHDDLSSCMQDQDSSFFQLYDDLENTSILYLTDGDNILLGRALIHDKVLFHTSNEESETIKVMDRIYSNNAITEGIFIQYAKKHNYYRKESQSLRCEPYIHPETNTATQLNPITIETDDLSGKYEKVPYVDTFSFYHARNGKNLLSNCNYLNIENYQGYSCTELRDTEGYDSNNVITEPEYKCANCNHAMSEAEGIYVENLGRVCDSCSQDYYYCDCCNTYVHMDDVVMIQDTPYCQYHARQDYTLCEQCGEYHDNDKTHDVENYGEVCEECLENGMFFYCDDCETWYKLTTDNHFYMPNLDKTVCESCYSDYHVCPGCADWFNESDCTYDTIEKAFYCTDCQEALEEERQEALEEEEFKTEMYYLETIENDNEVLA